MEPRARQKFFIRHIQTRNKPLYIPHRFYCGNASLCLCVCDTAFVFAIIGILSLFPQVPAYSCSRRSSLCKIPGGGLASFLLSLVSSRLGSSVSEQIKGGSQRRVRRPCSSHPLTWRALSLPPCTWSSTERLSLRAKIVHLLNYLLCCSFTASQDVCGNTF